jgi:hypothetical protein
MTTTRKQTPAQARKSALGSDLTPLYAVAGLTDAAVTTVRSTLAQTQEKAAKRASDLRAKPAQQADELARLITALPEQLKLLPEQVKGLPGQTRARWVDVQKQAESYLAEAGSAYADLAGRGKRAVDDALVTARRMSTKAEQKADDVQSDLADAVDPALEKVQETVTTARRSTTGRSATETTTPRSAAKASATRKASSGSSTAKKAPARKTAAKKAD